MTDPDIINLPIQPTGSGVADLEVAYEQMRLADDAGPATSATDQIAVADVVPTATDAGSDAAESAAHPS